MTREGPGTKPPTSGRPTRRSDPMPSPSLPTLPTTSSPKVRPTSSSAVDVVVVAFGAPELLEGCLAALDGQLPVLVVDNSSRSDIQAVSDRYGARYLDPGRNLGFAGGVNVGLLHRAPACGDVLLLNPDAKVTPDDVNRLVKWLHDHPGLGCVGPRQVGGSGGAEDRVGWPFPTPAGAWLEAVGLGGLRRKVEFVIGSVLLIRAEALDEVGPFDERFFLYAEETDWQRRAADCGWAAAVCAGVIAVHIGAGTGGDTSARQAHFHASHERYLRKYFGSRGWTVYRGAVLTGSALRACILPGRRGRDAADRFHLYRRGPCRVEAGL
jgi:GT2 family glycosyltransferase